MKSVIVGTAGHIDHGKTALVKALTGIDADRLEEEKRRGITIDIGFAHLELPLPSGESLRLGFVDVPGHERFVRNMLAGVGGIDLVLLVIAADESIKPQTREHFDICRLLSVRHGITVLTKSDLVDRETLDVVRLEVSEFLRHSFLDPARSPLVAVSSQTGAGLDDLRQALVKVAGEVPARDPSALARLPIDRVFTMKGFGTVVTGTLVSGTVRSEDEMEVLPGGQQARVRGVQVHGQPAGQAVAGERTALNLAGATKQELARGMVLAPPATFQGTSRIDVSLGLLASARPLTDRARVHLHAYTAEAIATVVLYGGKQVSPGGNAFAQLRLAEPMLLLPGDRFILRQFSPVVTIGGGVVLDNLPPLKVKNPAHADFLRTLQDESKTAVLRARVTAHGAQGLAVAEAVARTGWRRQEIESLASKIAEIANVNQNLVARSELDLAQKSLVSVLSAFHQQNPLVAGMSKEELRGRLPDIAPEVFNWLLAEAVQNKSIELAGELVRRPGQGVVMKDEEAESKQIIENAFVSAGLRVPALKDVLAGLPVDPPRAQKIVTLLLREKVLVKLSEELVFHSQALRDLRLRMAEEKAKSPNMDVARFKDLTGVSRKYAIPLLEYLDREHVTKRVGDARVIL
ncbi:MAG TPA: selenocysteine-specific translation elongation factor [Terriglobales bacterium]|jgi:selenocysteine-specific elongation factor|nr:selenocysteine-specific translation elongation factor [Terriglobales bacterium]